MPKKGTVQITCFAGNMGGIRLKSPFAPRKGILSRSERRHRTLPFGGCPPQASTPATRHFNLLLNHAGFSVGIRGRLIS